MFSSIASGRENRSIILLRYIRFVHKEIKYFKNSLIAFATNDDVFLTGLVLSGLYIKRNKSRINNIEESNSNKTNINDCENLNNNVEKIKIQIQIIISTMINKLEGEKLFSQKCDLIGLKGIFDLCICLNFKKGVVIFKEKI